MINALITINILALVTIVGFEAYKWGKRNGFQDGLDEGFHAGIQEGMRSKKMVVKDISELFSTDTEEDLYHDND